MRAHFGFFFLSPGTDQSGMGAAYCWREIVEREELILFKLIDLHLKTVGIFDLLIFEIHFVACKIR